VEAPYYKPEGRDFGSRLCYWYFSSAEFFGVGSDANRNKYQEYFLGGKRDLLLGLTTFSPSCNDCLEIWERQFSWNPQGLSRIVQDLFYLFIFVFFPVGLQPNTDQGLIIFEVSKSQTTTLHGQWDSFG